MITSYMTVERYNGTPHRARIGILTEPGLGNHVTLGVTIPGLDVSFHLNVEDLETLRARIDEVLAQLETIREAA